MIWTLAAVAVCGMIIGVVTGYAWAIAGLDRQTRSAGLGAGSGEPSPSNQEPTPVSVGSEAKWNGSDVTPLEQMREPQSWQESSMSEQDQIERIRARGDVTRGRPRGGLSVEILHDAREVGQGDSVLKHSRHQLLASRADGQTVTKTFADSLELTPNIFPGLATPMTIEVRNGLWFVTVGSGHPSALLRTEGSSLVLSPVEMPWRSGVIENGGYSFTGSQTPLMARLAVSMPPVTRLEVAVVGSWCAITDDNPALAVVAAHMFVPENIDPFGSWSDRLLAYTSSLNWKVSTLPTLVHFERGLLHVEGDVARSIGVGRTGDDAPAIWYDLPGFVDTTPDLARVWVPVTEDGQAQDSIVLDLAEGHWA